MRPRKLEILEEKDDDILILKVSENLISGYDSAILLDKINEQKTAGYKKIILELSGVQDINHTGMGALMASEAGLNDVKGQIIFANISKQIKAMFDTTGMAVRFIICKNIEQAIMYFNKK